MSQPPTIAARLIRLLPIFGFWTLIGLVFAGQEFISRSPAITWQQALSSSLANWYVFALLSILPVRLARRFGLDGQDWSRRFAIHFMTSAVFSILYVALRSVIAVWQTQGAGAS